MKRSLFSFLSLILIYSCNTTTRRTITEMEFNVDSSIVNKLVVDSSLGIRYSVPSGWDDFISEVEAKDSARGKIRVITMIQNPTRNVRFSLIDVRQIPASVFKDIDDNYKTALNPSGHWSNIQRDEFITAGYQVKQYVMAKQGETFFKMLFGDRMRPSFQVDYSVVVDSAYAVNTKTLESIIGSLHRDH